MIIGVFTDNSEFKNVKTEVLQMEKFSSSNYISKKYGIEAGSTVYVVREHLYYIPGDPIPRQEFCIYEAQIEYFRKGGYTDFKTKIKKPALQNNIDFFKLTDLNNNFVFSDKRSAALFAKDLTDKFEARSYRKNCPMMRRTWAVYLEDDKKEGEMNEKPKM